MHQLRTGANIVTKSRFLNVPLCSSLLHHGVASSIYLFTQGGVEIPEFLGEGGAGGDAGGDDDEDWG